MQELSVLFLAYLDPIPSEHSVKNFTNSPKVLNACLVNYHKLLGVRSCEIGYEIT